MTQESWGQSPAIPKPLSSSPAIDTASATVPTTASRTLMRFSVLLAALLYLDRVCISIPGAHQRGSGPDEERHGLHHDDVQPGLLHLRGARVAGWAIGIGPRKVITRIVVWWSAFTMATGLATGFLSLTIVRFLFGVGEAGAFPNFTKAFSNWFHGEDRTRAQSLMWLAARWGGALTPLLVVFTLEFVNWRESFYIFGALGFVWAFFFFRWFRDLPEQHPGVNAAELARLAPPAARQAAAHAHGNVPWRKFCTNRSVWLLCLQYACLSYGFWFYITWLPTYIREVFGLKDADRYLAGALAGLPLFLAGVSVYLTGKVTPWLIERVGSVARVRRGLGVAGCGIASPDARHLGDAAEPGACHAGDGRVVFRQRHGDAGLVDGRHGSRRTLFRNAGRHHEHDGDGGRPARAVDDPDDSAGGRQLAGADPRAGLLVFRRFPRLARDRSRHAHRSRRIKVPGTVKERLSS